MWRYRSIAASLVWLATTAALADGWVHSPDGRRVDRVAQPLPGIGVNLSHGSSEALSTNDAATAAACGWWRVVRAAQPTGTFLVARTWIIANGVAHEALSTRPADLCNRKAAVK